MTISKDTVERLAAILCVADRIQDPVEAEKIGTEVMEIRGVAFRASWEIQARDILVALGVVDGGSNDVGRG